MEQKFSLDYLDQLKELLDIFPHERFEEIGQALMSAYDKEKQVFIMGNGGSGSTASHFTCDINKGCCYDLEKKFKVICLNDNMPTILAYANDVSYNNIFVEQLRNLLQPGDVVIGISGSGNSENVLLALSYAKQKGARTIGLTGFDGGRLAHIVDLPFVAAIDDMQKVEDMHMIVVHMLMQYLCKALRSD
ncbi:MAG TPA: SIS domain-containing protein [Nitrospirae bacterium]|nr:phosphoheptose isomerase [bacterium BMS3Abin06]HDH12744.1 SIS domain-containing protein [Nitrospirota bacterium]HDZ00053.1 SIS domain-containing protein [Nitrospirota bacterium]